MKHGHVVDKYDYLMRNTYIMRVSSGFLWVFSTHMRLECFVALPFIGPLHFIKRITDERP
jgi:hypothetical protein